MRWNDLLVGGGVVAAALLDGRAGCDRCVVGGTGEDVTGWLGLVVWLLIVVEPRRELANDLLEGLAAAVCDARRLGDAPVCDARRLGEWPLCDDRRSRDTATAAWNELASAASFGLASTSQRPERMMKQKCASSP